MNAGTRPRTGSSAAKTREPTPVRLLEAAIESIEQGGEASVNLREIASACGVTTPIIYKAFGSREGLVVAAQAERFRRAIAALAEPFALAVESATTAEEFRRVITELLAATHHADRAPYRRVQIAVLGASIDRPALRAAVDVALRSLIDRTASALEVARSRGLVRADAALPELLWWFFGQVQGRLLIEQSGAPIDVDAWNATSARAVTAVLCD